MTQPLFTIGYEGVTPGALLAALHAARVEVLVDVRAIAASRRRGFAKTALRAALEDGGISYLHVPALGNPKDGREAAWSGDLRGFRAIFRTHLRGSPAKLPSRPSPSRHWRRGSASCAWRRTPRSVTAPSSPPRSWPSTLSRCATSRSGRRGMRSPPDGTERVVVLVKAVPNPSKTHGETVCCAGVTLTREWRRLFPVRFRHLGGEQQFRRWQWVSYRAGPSRDAPRRESRRVHEESLATGEVMPEGERAGFLDRLVGTGLAEATARGDSLALVRPRSTRFYSRKRSTEDV